MNARRLPMRIDPAPDAVDPELEPLLGESFARARAADDANASAAGAALRRRLLERLSASRSASGAMVTARRARLAPSELAPGVRARILYLAPGERPLRAGEPLRVRLIELQAGARWSDDDASRDREWLVLQGSVLLDGQRLRLRDYHRASAGAAAQVLAVDGRAVVFLRESRLPPDAADQGCTVRDADAGWPQYAPGIRRRVLWQRDGQAAMLYHAGAGASIPLHRHDHDEECLMVQGELFLDDVLLQPGDYQLAPAGTAHRITETDTGVVIFAHGDLELKFIAA